MSGVASAIGANLRNEAFVMRLLADGTTGIFNTAGPDDATTMADLLAMCAEVTPSQPELVWRGGIDLPLTTPGMVLAMASS
ncbi:MAG: hypothetical protein ABWZ16_06480 [Microbacterium sp.]